MLSRTERYLTNYFRLLAISCWARNRAMQTLLSGYALLMLCEACWQLVSYWRGHWDINDFQHQQRQQFKAFVVLIDIINVLYKLVHSLIIAQALLWRSKALRLESQLQGAATDNTLVNALLHLGLDCLVNGFTLALAFGNAVHNPSRLLTDLRFLFTTQAVRARYLQLALLVGLLDGQLAALQQQLSSSQSNAEKVLQLRSAYARIVQLTRSLMQFYGPSLLLMNILCIGDFLMVCYAYIMVWESQLLRMSWLLLWQSFYVMLPTLVKICTLCSACHSCGRRSVQLLAVLNASQRATLKAGNSNDKFALQIMQNPIEFVVCGMYKLNLQTLTAMFVFILQSLVIFLQFVALTKQQSSS